MGVDRQGEHGPAETNQYKGEHRRQTRENDVELRYDPDRAPTARRHEDGRPGSERSC